MQELKNLLSSKQNVVITTHVNPDGDAIGSSIALLNFLIADERKATWPFYSKSLGRKIPLLMIQEHELHDLKI